MERLPLTLLMHNGPIGRAYLGMLAALGYQPERLVLMVYRHHPGTGRAMGQWLALPSWRRRYRVWAQDLLLNQWSRLLARRFPAFHASIAESLTTQLDLPQRVINAVTESVDWTKCADSTEFVEVDNLKDDRLSETLEGEAGLRPVLYTGGGLVPKSLLDVHGLKVLHIHPGWLPDIKGADGILWSTLVRGRPAATCFQMTPGLDAGPIITRREFDPLGFESHWYDQLDQSTLYRAIYAFVDPAIRASVLRQLVQSNSQMNNLPTVPQDPEQGVVYHFMHSKLRQHALYDLFHGARTVA